MEKKRNYTVWIITCITCLILFVLIAIGTSTAPLTSHTIRSYEEIISLTDFVDSEGNETTLPISLNYTEGVTYSYSTVIPKEIELIYAPSLYLATRYFNADFYVDNKLIGSCYAKPDDVNNSLGKVLKIIPFSDEFVGKTLRIDIELMLGNEASYLVSPILIGNESDLLFKALNEDFAKISTSMIMLFFAFLFLILGIQKKKIGLLSGIFKTGLTAFLFALYSMCTSDVSRLIIPNSYFLYTFEFILLATFPLPLISAIGEKCKPAYKNMLFFTNILLFLNLLVQTFLHFFTPYELRNTVVLTHACILLSISYH